MVLDVLYTELGPEVNARASRLPELFDDNLLALAAGGRGGNLSS